MQPATSKTPFRVRPLPCPKNPLRERRKQRSTSAAEALELALNRAADRGSLDAVLIADDLGMIVAHSDTRLDLAMVAAVTPIVGRGRASATVKRAGQPRALTVRPLHLQDETFYVAALGGNFGDRNREVASSAAATKRILA